MRHSASGSSVHPRRRKLRGLRDALSNSGVSPSSSLRARSGVCLPHVVVWVVRGCAGSVLRCQAPQRRAPPGVQGQQTESLTVLELLDVGRPVSYAPLLTFSGEHLSRARRHTEWKFRSRRPKMRKVETRAPFFERDAVNDWLMRNSVFSA